MSELIMKQLVDKWKDNLRKDIGPVCAWSDALEKMAIELVTFNELEPKSNQVKICIVPDCENKNSQGSFVGDICFPCYETVTKGAPNSALYYMLYKRIFRRVSSTFRDRLDQMEEHVEES